MTWRRLREPIFPWVRTLDKVVASIDPPTFLGRTLLVATDSSGLHKRSKYRADAFLCVDMEHSQRWETDRLKVRRDFLADGRRIAYKNLGDTKRAEALIPFLSSALEIRGLLLVVITNKKLTSLCLGMARDPRIAELAFRANWKPAELDSAFRVTHIISCLIAGLSYPGQDVYWLSDQDNLLGNERQKQDVARLAGTFSSYYVPHSLGAVGIGTTQLDDGDRWEEDLTAVADIAAGGLAETTNQLARYCGGHVPPSLAVEFRGVFLPKARLVADWFWTAPGSLARVAMVFEQTAEQQYAVFKHELMD